jgi:hypothetical protein
LQGGRKRIGRLGSRAALAAIAGAAIWLAVPEAASAATPFCDGDGGSGKRVQAVYAHVTGEATDPNADSLITAWSGEVDNDFNVSAHRSQAGSFAHPRWVFTLPCSNGATQFSVSHITVANPNSSFNTLRSELQAAGLTDLNRKYMVWMDQAGSAGCPGPISDFLPDTNPDPSQNISNQNPGTGFNRPMYAVLCHGSWSTAPNPGLFNRGPQHELIHTLGGVNRAAPNSNGGHCWDFWDALCAEDDAVDDDLITDIDYPFTTHCVPNTCAPVCNTNFEGVDVTLLLDCNNDDYFSMNPAPGNYLASCWNTAKSNFLVTSGVTPTTAVPGACDLPQAPPGGGGGSAAPPPSGPGNGVVGAKKRCKKKHKHRAAAAKKCKKQKGRAA